MMVPVQTEEKRVIKRQSNLAGLVLLLTLVMSYGASFVLMFLQMFGIDTGLSTQTVNGTLYAADPNAYLVTNTVYYLAAIGLPALIGCLVLRSNDLSMSVSRPVKGALWTGYLLIGMGLCVFANIVAYGTNIVFAFFSLFPSDVPVTADGTWLNWVLSMISTAVLPAVLEELLFRGTVITLLRPAGERNAILISAIAFSLAHGTLTQIPFAFVLGLVFGFLYIRTGSLLLPMALHFLNNAMAVTIESLIPVFGEDTVTVGCYLLFAVLALVGLIAAAFLRAHADYPLQPIGDSRSTLPGNERFKAALWTPVLVLFLALSLLILPQNIVYDPNRIGEEMTVGDEQPSTEDAPFFENGGSESAVIAWQ